MKSQSGVARLRLPGLRSVASGMALLAILALCVAPAGAVSWFDDFDDMDPLDGSPVTWTPNPTTGFGPIFPGDYNATTGDYALTGQDLQGAFGLFDDNDEVLLAVVEDVIFTDGVSVRARAQIIPFGGIGVLANITPLTVTTYYGVFHNDGMDDGFGNGVPTGELEFSRFDGGEGEFEFAEVGPLDPIVAPEDVVVQLDAFGGLIELRYWKPGEPQPSVPQTFVMDSTYTAGAAGIVFNDDEFQGDPATNGSGIFRWAKAASTKLIDGDMDADGDVDFDDIDDFVLGLNDPVAYEAANGFVPLMLGDTDNDGDQDFDDISLFVTILTSGSGQVASVPEPATWTLLAAGLVAVAATRWLRRV